MTEKTMRLSRLMGLRGLCSRREADRYIERGQVRVDGEIISELGTKVSEDAHVELLPAARKSQEQKVTILLHKPLGYVSTQPEKNYREALELITPENEYSPEGGPQFQKKHLLKLACSGRLDIDSKGLLVFTQDGSVAKSIIGPESRMEKEYLVRVSGRVTKEILQQLRKGMELDGKNLREVSVDELRPQLLRMILTEGRKRQIRRMCEQGGLKVTGLKRVRVGNVRLSDLPEGKWRYLRDDEAF